MIPLGHRFAPITGGGLYRGTTGTVYDLVFQDWDVRRHVVVSGETPKHLPEDDAQAYENLEDKLTLALQDNASRIIPPAWAFRFGPQLDLISADKGQSLEYDPRDTTPYPLLSGCPHLAELPRFARDELIEVDRMQMRVDKCVHTTKRGDQMTLVVKYALFRSGLESLWQEIDIWRSIPPHPNIVTINSLIVDEVEHRLVGFSTPFVPGGTLEKGERTFKLKWLKDLLQAIDQLNLQHGVMHRDIHPRNMVVDPRTDKLQLIDFNHARRIGPSIYHDVSDIQSNGLGLWDHDKDPNNDISGAVFSLYELITGDFENRGHWEQLSSPKVVLDLTTWQHDPLRKLDHEVEVYRDTLTLWIHSRKDKDIKIFTDCPQHVPDFEPMPKRSSEPPSSRDKVLSSTSNGEWDAYGRYRVKWDRPAQEQLHPGVQYLFSGKPVPHPHLPLLRIFWRVLGVLSSSIRGVGGLLKYSLSRPASLLFRLLGLIRTAFNRTTDMR
ncbi:kinase-like domain-containing protein [Elsinoe ampelina]|uniref:Kinase-like domain-containing protein n=1 Tax=Elsinoe ampelina TaxID=302913 RepID=A0A6A6GPZ5_9PEZI|nr:kinase-like domain-containing protein [Elsinoe ampelina]